MDNNVDTIKIAAEKRAIKIGADFNVYTEGLASGDLLDVPEGVVVTRGKPSSPEVLETIQWRAATLFIPMRKKRRLLRKRYTGYKLVCRKIFQ